ncbi:glycosyltransferase family 4 protein [Larkinella soli]|uniref:glycosyltransferase family 4 protein n=1 Tax=Larkinella soli TaxID=1770527 RepID=UPI000FFC2327|nr:glycosyltransferase family 4 protein [Larkinella soli]
MKVLFLTHRFYPDIGGIEVNSEILATSFHEAGHDVRLVTWTGQEGEKKFPFQVVRQPSGSTLFDHHRWADIVFENNPCLRLAWPTLFFRKPSVVALRTWIRRTNGEKHWQDRLKFLWLQRTKAVIAVSDAVRKADWPPAVVIGNPYRTHLFRRLPDVPKTRDFVFLGRLVSDKGAALAVEALHRLRTVKGGEALGLTIIGDGPERENLEKLADQYGLQDRVTFTGALRGEELVRSLNAHRFLLVPSFWEEPFGNVALEGMACGCLPLVSDGGGLPDAVGKAGLTFARGDVDAMVACIRRLLDDPNLEKRLRDAADRHLSMHHPKVVSGRYLEVLETAFAKTGPV